MADDSPPDGAPPAAGDGGDREAGMDVDGLTDARTPAELSHELYVDVTALREALPAATADRSLEVGCGYGRLTPWIADAAAEHHALDRDAGRLRAARREYPDVAFHRGAAAALPFPADAFDLAVTWGVLNHVPAERIGAATAELDRVVAPSGRLVVSEATAGRPDPRWEYRSVAEWRDLFASRELVDRVRTDRDAEPFRDPAREHVALVFA